MTTGRPPEPRAAPPPLWLKIAFTAFVAVLVPVYWREYGPSNFLWFSDIALFAVVATLWMGHPLPASMAAVGVLFLELIWTVDFLLLLLAGTSPVGLAEYMVDDAIPAGVRALSLFHLALPPLLVWLMYRLGYDRRAFIAQTALALIVLPVTWALTSPDDNINWVFGLADGPQETLPPLAYLALLMALFPAVIYLPSHLLFKKLFPRFVPPSSAA
jgi:hypothetical protein